MAHLDIVKAARQGRMVLPSPASPLPLRQLLPAKIGMKTTSSNWMRRTFLLILPTLYWALGGLALAQSESNHSSPVRTLEELKESGARKSMYLKHQATPTDAEVAPEANLKVFRETIQPVLSEACVDCHGADTQEGNFRIDKLDPDLIHGDDVDWWLEVLAVLSKGEMPPPDDADLSDKHRAEIVGWLTKEIQVASLVRRNNEGHSSFRRMTRYEYNYALQDLLGLPFDFAKDLPPESNSEDGFQNSSEMLHMSLMQFGTYRQAARDALKLATVKGEQPAPQFWSVSMKDAAKSAWAKQEEQLKKIREQHENDEENKDEKDSKDDPEKQEQLKEAFEKAIAKKTAGFRRRPNRTHYQNPTTGFFGQASWSYGGARHAWKPTTDRPEVPLVSDHVVVIPRNQKLIVELGDTVPNRGTLRVRVRAAIAGDDKGKDEKRKRKRLGNERHPRLQLEYGWQASNDSQANVKVSNQDLVIDAPAGAPVFYEWQIPLSTIYPRNSVRNISKMGDLPSPSEYIKLVNRSASYVDIAIDHVEITAPYYEQWPSASHRRVFPDNDQEVSESTRARELLSKFISKAWRRKATKAEIETKLALFESIRPASDDFQDAMIEVYATVLSSPKFLYLIQSAPETTGTPKTNQDETDQDKTNHGKAPQQKSAPLNSTELATRLSMFLWCSTPDDKLIELATQGKLDQPRVLNEQIDRMLADPRSQRFSKQFMRQWLGMQLLDYLDVDRKAYPQFDPALKQSMQEEPIAFFSDVLQNNHSVLDFVHANYTMANQRLSKHYGLDGVYGNEFRRVEFQPAHRRGGFLTQAGFLAMNSDGKDSHPLKRGIWLLERLLNDPPPPPPPAVPEIDLADPEIAKLTLKERIEDHRNQAACMSCHEKIDPWGIAFENYDAVGKWRDKVNGKPVDASAQLFNGQPLDGMDGLKRFLLENRQDQFVRALAHKMTTYALGRPLRFGDRSSVDAITADVRKQGDGLATMIKTIVGSELFQSH